LFIKRAINTDYWSNENWTLTLGRELTKPVIYDTKPIKIKEEKESDNSISYVFDSHYAESSGEQPLYANSTGNLIEKINEYLEQINLPIGIFRSNQSNESVVITIHVPESLVFLSSLEEDKTDFKPEDKLKFLYYNPRGYFSFIFLKKEHEDKFIELEKDNKVFFIQNESLLVSSVKEALRNEDVIFNYPAEKKDFITIGLGNTTRLNRENVDAAGLYLPNDVILIDKSFYEKFFNESLWSTNESLVTVLIHELTHYSSYYEYTTKVYPKWLEEGLAVYSEIKYAEKNIPEALKNSPAYASLHSTKPSIELLERWYENNESFEEVSYEFSGPELYSIYGFIVNYYANAYGETNLKFALNYLRDKEANENREEEAENLESLAEFSLSLFSGNNVNKEELFFPKKELFLQNRTMFIEEMLKFSRPLYSELLASNNFTRLFASPAEYTSTEKIIIDLIIVLSIVIAVALVVLIVAFVNKKFNEVR